MKNAIKILKQHASRFSAKVVNESAGRWNVFQIEAPAAMLWNDGDVSALRVEWPVGQTNRPAILDAISRMECGLRPMEKSERHLYAND